MRLEKSDVSDEDIRSLLSWLEEDPEHRTEFLQLVELWDNLDILSELSEIIPLEQKRAEPQAGNLLPGFAYRHRFAAAVVFSALMVLTVFSLKEWIAAPGVSPLADTQKTVFTTPVGESDDFDLPDGSRIRLNTNSHIMLDYGDHFRHVYLERGEAYFEVAPDPLRPFVVYVGKGSITALGTAFNINYAGGIIDVMVTEGNVEVAAWTVLPGSDEVLPEENALRTKVSAGQTVQISDTVIRAPAVIELEQVEHELAWQRGMLIFNGDPLEDAVNEISRYTNTKIVIHDDSIGKIPIGGYFKIGEIEAMLNAFESSFGIAVDRVSDDLVLLSKRSDFAAD